MQQRRKNGLPAERPDASHVKDVAVRRLSRFITQHTHRPDALGNLKGEIRMQQISDICEDFGKEFNAIRSQDERLAHGLLHQQDCRFCRDCPEFTQFLDELCVLRVDTQQRRSLGGQL